MFCDKNLAKYSAKHPGLSQQELSRLMAKEFAKLSPEKKKLYDNMAKQSKKQAPNKETAEPENPKPKKGKKDAGIVWKNNKSIRFIKLVYNTRNSKGST